MGCLSRGRNSAVVVTTLALLVLVLGHATEMTYVGVFHVIEGETVTEALKVSALETQCPGGVLSYSVLDPLDNIASFPNLHDPTIQFTAAFTGMTTGVRRTYVDLRVLCSGTTPVGGTVRVYFSVLPSTTTTTTTTSPPTTTTTTTTSPPTTTTTTTSSPTTTTTTSSPTTTTTAPIAHCPGDFQYSLMLNTNGSFTQQAASLFTRVAAAGTFCLSGGISATLTQPTHGLVRSESMGIFYYTPEAPQAGDNVDSFGFELMCSSDGTKCTGTAVISILSEDKGDIYYAMNGAITCRGTCDAAAWRTDPTALDLFDVSETGVAATPRKDGRSINGIDFSFTGEGELLIHAYTTIGNMAARFVTFYPLSTAHSQGLLNSTFFPDGSHVSFEPSCLNKQASVGKGSDIWSWTDTGALEGHLNLQTGEYKSGDNYYQKFGGNHRQCDVYRTDPCKHAPLMTPTLNEDTHNVYNNVTHSVQWKLYINDCDATWVGRASVASLRALRQPDNSPTFRLEGNGRYLVGTVYSQSLKPANWTSPSAGVVHSETAYDLRLKIHNIIIVDAVSHPAIGSNGPQLQVNADIQYAPGTKASTLERLYRYSVLLYPYFAENNTAANITDLSLQVVSTTLLNSTWTSPSKAECPKCTGTMISCTGTGNGFETDCGDKAMITFETLVYNSSDFEKFDVKDDPTGKSASTSVSPQNALRVTFAARANGAGSAELTGAYPVGSFAIAVKLSSGQVFDVVVNHTDYISELNTRFLDTKLCRPSAYWPVPDPLGCSIPVKPFSAEALAMSHVTSTSEKEKEGEKAVSYYGLPERLLSQSVCSTLPNAPSHQIDLDNMTAVIDQKNEQVTVSMCAVPDERTFGTTDWVMISFPDIHEKAKMINSEEIQSIIDDDRLSNDSYTAAVLQYLTLSVHSSEVMPSWLMDDSAGGYVDILLDGQDAPKPQPEEEQIWMYLNGSSSSNSTSSYLPWEVYASSLSYRRISHHLENNTRSEPFHFAFVPGSLLHSGSSIRVPMIIRAAIKFVTYAFTEPNATHAPERVIKSERQETLLYIFSVSRGIPADLRFDTGAYHSVITRSGIAKKPATAILIVLFVAIVCVLAASVYVEVTYKHIIHSAKYHPERPSSAVGIRYGCDGKPKEGQTTAQEGSRTEAGAPFSASKAGTASGAATDEATTSSVKTRFGIVCEEQKRVPESVAGSISASSDVGGVVKPSNDYSQENRPIGEEQSRLDDDEVAEV